MLKAKAVPKYVVDIGLNVLPAIHMYHEIKNFNKYFYGSKKKILHLTHSNLPFAAAE